MNGEDESQLLELANSFLNTAQEKIKKLEEEKAILIEALKLASKTINDVKYELNARIYMLYDDEMGWIFHARDVLDKALEKVGSE